MIMTITIENFKGVGERIEVPIRPMTLLFGPNSGGKSTIHHAMLYAFEVLDRHNCDAHTTVLGGDSVDLGGFDEMVHRHDTGKSIRLRFDLDLSAVNLTSMFPVARSAYDAQKHGGELADIGHSIKSAWVELEISRGHETGGPVVRWYEVGLNGIELARISYRPYTPFRVNLHHPILAWPAAVKQEWGGPRVEGTHGPLDCFCPGLLNGYDRIYRSNEEDGVYESCEEVSHEEFRRRIEGSDDLTGVLTDECRVDDITSGTLRCYVICPPGDPTYGAGVKLYIGRHSRTGDIVCCLSVFPGLRGAARDTAKYNSQFDEPSDNEVEGTSEAFAHEASSEVISLLKLEQAFRFRMDKDALPDLESPLRFAEPVKTALRAPAEAEHFAEQLLTRLIVGPVRTLRDHLRGIRYLGPIRQTPPPDHVPPDQPDSSRWASGLGAWDALVAPGADGLVKQVSNWLGPDHLATGYRLAVRDVGQVSQPGNQTGQSAEAGGNAPGSNELPESASQQPCGRVVYLHDIDRRVDLSLHSVGVGLSQVIPVLTLALMDGVSLCVMEQPELHLHPRQQAALGDLLVEAANRRSKQLMVETHSEHMILRLLRRIRETTRGKTPAVGTPVTPKDVAICYVRPEKGQMKVIVIDVDDDGEFVQPWPDDFFEVDFYERFA